MTVYDQNWNPVDESTLTDADYENKILYTPQQYQTYLNQAIPERSSYGGTLTNTNKLLSQLGQQYGLTNADWNKAMQSYLHNSGATANDQNWWGDNTYTRAYLEGLGQINPAYAGKFDSYLSDPNFRAGEQSQSQAAASTGMAHQVQPKDIMDTLGPMLMLGMGGGALLGGLGALGGAADPLAVGGADWMGEIAAGAGNGGLGSVAGGVGNFVPEAAAGGTGSGAGGNVGDFWDEIMNSLGPDTSAPVDTSGGSVLGDTGSDWSTGGTNPGSGNVMTPGNQGPGLWESIKGSLSNLPPGTQSAIKAMVSGGSGTPRTGTGSALSNILGGNGTASDWTSMLGNLGTGALSAYSANKYADNMKALADRSWQAGDDYRNRLWSSYNDPNAFLANSPDIQASVNQGTNALARSLSTQGNPTGNGHALQELQNYATQGLYGQLGNARQQLANFGGLSAITGSAPQAAANSAEAGSNIYNSLANTTSRLTQPATDWQSIMKSFGNQNYLA